MIIKNQPEFENKDDLFEWLGKNCDDLIYESKGTIKHADSPDIAVFELRDGKTLTSKSENFSQAEEGVIKARLIINTTNLFDSHKDVHIPGLWDKSLRENKRIKHKQEHGSRFKDVIADKKDLKAFTKTYKWEELGYSVEGKTEALTFDSTIRKSRNLEMYNEYKDDNVDNHSVGMQYVKMVFAMNSDKDHHAQYKINWDKYISQVVNKKDAEKAGYFWPVLEAKVREGSAVVDGSNPITPTMSRKEHSDKEIKIAANKALSNSIIKFLKS